MIGYVVRAEVVLGDTDDTGRRPGQPIFSVCGVVVMRGDGPSSVLERDLEGSGRCRFLIEVDDLECRGHVGVVEIGEEGLTLVEESVGSGSTWSAHKGEKRQGQRARKGIFITTSNYTKEALDYVENIETKIILIDGQRLAELMIAYNVGANTTAIYEVKKIDSDYFIEE